ncbi:MAG TPA: ABC transporter permease [Holophagaceae bacterium]|nr:ABC transporter permease [Holophagaceae bacterium]
MRGTWLIFRKEMFEFSKDRKTVFLTFILPLILYPAIFTMMTKLAKGDSDKQKGRPSRVVLNDPTSAFRTVLQQNPKEFELVEAPAGDLKKALLDQKLDLILDVDAEATAKLARQETFTLSAQVDESERASELALKRIKKVLEQQNSAWVKTRLEAAKASSMLAEPAKLVEVKASDSARELGKALGAWLPYILIIVMYAGAMQHGAYVTAGEKERGTLLSLLSTRLSRKSIIYGKLLMVFTVGLGSAVASLAGWFLGFAALSKEIGDSAHAAAKAGAAAPQVSAMANLANPGNLLLALLLVIPVGLLFSSIIVLLGTQARNTREATMAMTPGIFIVMMLGMFSSAPGVEKMAALPWVPILNVSLAIRKLFGEQLVVWEYALALGMTVVLAATAVALAAKLLDREEALFKV